MEIVPQVLFVLLLIFLNGFFVAAEFSLVSVRKTRIDTLAKKKKNVAARLVQRALVHLDRYISATQLGITVASIGLGWVGEPVIARLVEPLFWWIHGVWFGITTHTIATIIAFSLITILHIVLGELVPKTLALAKAEAVALLVIVPLAAFVAAFKPFIWILDEAGYLVLAPFGFARASHEQLVHSEEEIRMLLEQSGQSGEIPKEEVRMVHNVFRFGDTPVKDIMTHRSRVVAVPTTATIDEVAKIMETVSPSRLPVYKGTIDKIIGFVHVKDIYKAVREKKGKKKLAQAGIIRDILYVPENKKIDDVLLEMRRRRVHMAVVRDEYGGTAGIVTLEDVLERLVGEIQDEFEVPTKTSA